MKIIFLLETKDGIVGEFHYEWECPFVPRIGEHVHIENIFDKGEFIVCDDDNIMSKVDDFKDYIISFSWEAKGVTWCKHDEYFLLMSLFGE
ncbi:MAG: hypothetical protein LBJ60_03685 [Tannerellaceae bacterium]|jgi:hypothetical protein|nr:hypothetical protein [Tannerellaceae bacterium]